MRAGVLASWPLFAIAILITCACGYRPLVREPAAGERLAVVLADSSVPDQVAATEVVSAVRAALSREGMLAPGDRYPRVEVEVLRVDEVSEGVEASASLQPVARATRLAVVARGVVVVAQGAPAFRDTGDVRATVLGARMPGARAEAFARPELVRAAARRAGERIGARVLGHPAVSEPGEDDIAP